MERLSISFTFLSINISLFALDTFLNLLKIISPDKTQNCQLVIYFTIIIVVYLKSKTSLFFILP